MVHEKPFVDLHPWPQEARIELWDLGGAQDAPMVTVYVPQSPDDRRDLTSAVVEATSGKVRPRRGARAELVGDAVLIYRHGEDRNPTILERGYAEHVRFNKSDDHPVGVKYAATFLVGPNGEIVPM